MTEDEFDAWTKRLEEMRREYMIGRHYPEYPKAKQERYLAEDREWMAYFGDMCQRVMLGGGEDWEREFCGANWDEDEDGEEDLTL